jgi:hypothetical protein
MLTVEDIKRCLSLQRELLGQLVFVYPGALESEFLLELPKSGAIFLNGDLWQFQRHGAGVRFLRNVDQFVVDVPNLVTDADAFDSWRITQYFNSLRRTEVQEREIETALTILVARGDLVRDQRQRTVYRLNKGE